jgi:thiamine-monophosphate kinase
VARQLQVDPYELAATAGEDYELLATVPPENRDDVGLRWIGRVTDGEPEVRFAGARGPHLGGYRHSL